MRSLDAMFQARDVNCYNCGARPGELCYPIGDKEECRSTRADTLRLFLEWLAKQKTSAAGMTKKRVREVIDMIGIHIRSYDKDGFVLERVAKDAPLWWYLYIGGRMDGTKSVWLTPCGTNLSDPARGPFRNKRELAFGLRAWGRCAWGRGQ